MSLLGQFHVPMFSWLRYHYRANISALPSPLSTLSLSLPHSWLLADSSRVLSHLDRIEMHIAHRAKMTHKPQDRNILVNSFLKDHQL